VKIAFTSADGKPQTVYYFSTDVSYGSYLAPIPFYGGRYYQRQLSNLFQLQHAKPIAFGVGYHWRLNKSHLLLATRQRRRAAP